MRSYPVKENPIGSAVREILWYRHTDTQTHRHPVTLVKGFLRRTTLSVQWLLRS